MRQKRNVNVQHVIASNVLTHLTNRFEKRQALDVTNRAANFDDQYIRAGLFCRESDAPFDFVCDVWNDLDGATEKIAAAFFRNHFTVHLSRRHVRGAREILVNETFVMTQVEIGFCAVLGHKDFAVLVRRHGAGIHIDVRIEFLN